MKNVKLVSGGIGPERVDYVKKYLDDLINDKEEKNIIIYDATYGLVSLAKYPFVKYFCVDSVLKYIEILGTISNSDHNIKTYIVSDCYAGLFYSSENRNILKDLIINKDKYNIEIVLVARHIDFIPEEISNLITDRLEFKETNTVLANNVK